jgi:quercetin dioxygenase-like cupin family protein
MMMGLYSERAGHAQDDEAKPTPLKPESAPVRIGRRVITGIDSQGRSRIESEEPVPVNAKWTNDGAQGLDFWVVRQVPTPLVGALEPTADWQMGNSAPSGGVIGRLITWDPGFEYPLHTTPTLDFGVILSGQLELILDKESRVLNPGDVVIQRGTAHAWRVIGPEPCTWAVILIDARPHA